MKFLIFLIICLVASIQATRIIRSRENIESLSVEHVEYINQLNTTWKATQNFKGYTIDELKGLCGTIIKKKNESSLPSFKPSSNSRLPKEFDSRKQWPECTDVISHIRDQGACGSCWAVATASAITDRVCIATQGKNKTQLSAQILTSCCDECFFTEGCHGGFPMQAYLYWVERGLVTGGDFGDTKTCYPYLIAPCEHHVNGTLPKCGEIVKTPKCAQKCINKQIELENDKVFGKDAYQIEGDYDKIKTELMNGGPMTAGFDVYDDFFLYKEGVYKVTEGARLLGGHAVVVIGWGSYEGGEYWLVKNNWNSEWGDRGYFKIGMDQAGISQDLVSGIPNTSK